MLTVIDLCTSDGLDFLQPVNVADIYIILYVGLYNRKSCFGLFCVCEDLIIILIYFASHDHVG